MKTRFAVALALLALVPTAFADTAVFTSVDDNTLIEDPVGAYSSGASLYFFAGRVGNNGGATRRRGALRFDLSSIPQGSTVTSVSLRMYCSAAGTNAAQTISLRRFNASWGEGASSAFGGGGSIASQNDVTWIHRFFPGQPWTTPGGDFSAVTTVSRSVTGQGSYTWDSTPQFVADVQAMVSAPQTNFGWCVLGNEVTLQSVKRFDSHESTVASTRPQLTVVYTPGPSYDLNGDNRVNGSDLAILLARWGLGGTGDYNGDGVVSGPDLALLLSYWTG